MNASATLAPAAVDETPTLDELADRALLDELCQSLFSLFGIPVRVFSQQGNAFGVVAHEHEFCAFVCTSKEGRALCRSTVDAVKASSPNEATIHPCFTGLSYHIEPVIYETQIVGRVVIGPFAAPTLSVPASQEATATLQSLPQDKLLPLFGRVPKAKPETVARVASHLKTALDILLFNAHKTVVTSSTHLLTVRESFRELSEKTARLEAAYEKLKEADRLKASFLATVSHELKTPLTSILGYSEMLTEGLAGDLSTEQSNYVQIIHEKGTHLLEMITGLLDLSKMEIGTMRLQGESAFLYDVLGEVWTTLLPAAKKKGVDLKFACEQSAFAVRVDPPRMRQVFTNLVENAIKFTERGGSVRMEDSIEVAHDSQGHDVGMSLLGGERKQLEVRIVDTGPGIAEAERERIFDAFYQIDSSSTREHGGTGLGLAIAKRVVEAHGGTIEVRDNAAEGGGSIFVVTIPSESTPRISVRSVALFADPVPGAVVDSDSVFG